MSDVPGELPLGLFAQNVGKRGAGGMHDGAQRIGDFQAPELDAAVGRAKARSALRPDVDDLADANGMDGLREEGRVRRRAVLRVVRIPRADGQVARSVGQDGIWVESRSYLVELGRTDLEP